MDNLDRFIHQLDIQYLTNKKQYDKYINSENSAYLNKKDQKFYRKRILALTKDLLYETDPSANIVTDVKYAFQHYIKTCMQYFKSQDRSDILQEEYSDILDKSLSETNIHCEYDALETNKVMMCSVPFKKNTLDKFVKRIQNEIAEEVVFPQKKNINLKDPSLKDKGLEKNKNITNNYETKEHIKTESKTKENKQKISNTSKDDKKKKSINAKPNSSSVQPKDESK